MRRISTITVNPSIDINTRIDHVIPERKLRCDTPVFEPGGGGLNVSRAIAKLGGESTAYYIAGGPTGDLLGELLEREQIDYRPINTSTRTRENLIVYERSTGNQFRFGMPGSPSPEEVWTACLKRLEEDPFPDFLVVSGSGVPGIPSSFYGTIAELVRKNKGYLIADSSGKDLKDLLEAGVFLVKPNLNELRIFSGRELLDETEMEKEAQRIVRNGFAKACVVSIGAAGVLYVSETEQGRVRAPTVPIRSKVGAGDSTVAGITLALARGKGLLDAVRFGVAAGASAVMTPGTELCRREDTERLYAILNTSEFGPPSVIKQLRATPRKPK